MTAPTPLLGDIISRSAAAKQLGVHVNTLDRVVKKLGLRKYEKIGDSRVFFLRADIDAVEIINVVKDPS